MPVCPPAWFTSGRDVASHLHVGTIPGAKLEDCSLGWEQSLLTDGVDPEPCSLVLAGCVPCPPPRSHPTFG